MEDEGKEGIIEMDNPTFEGQDDDQGHDTVGKPVEAAEFERSEGNIGVLSPIHPPDCESRLLVGQPPLLSGEEGETATMSVEAEMHVSEISVPEIDVSWGLDDDKVTEEGKTEGRLVEDTPLISVEPDVDLLEEMARNEISLAGEAVDVEAVNLEPSLNFDGPNIESSQSLDVTQDEVIMEEEETQMEENEMKMKDAAGKEWSWTPVSDPQFASVDPLIDSDLEAILANSIPTRTDYDDIEIGDKSKSFEDGAGSLQSFVQSSIPADNPQNIDAQSPIASKMNQEDENSAYMTLSGTVDDIALEPDNVEESDYQSLPVPLVSVGNEVTREENVGVEEADATEETEENPIQLLDDIQTVDDESTNDHEHEEPMEEDEELMEENETPTTEMEVETEMDDVTEMAEQDNEGDTVDLQTVDENPIQLLDDLQTVDENPIQLLDDLQAVEENPIQLLDDLETVEENPIQLLDDLQTIDVDSTKDEEEEDDTPTAETEMETETYVPEMPEKDNEADTLTGKRKRGKNSKVPLRASSKKATGEDVCFICFDGGELVHCNRRGCHKAYHPSCVNHDEEFFQSEGRWNCGWHLCSICEKNARYMCYTCTFSLCQKCTKDAVISCVRGNKGFCETCMKTVMSIENNDANKEDQVDFDDKSSWEYLFKNYWTNLKGKLALTIDELAQINNPHRMSVGRDRSNEVNLDANDGDSGSDNSENLADRKPQKRMAKRKLHENTEEADFPNTSVKASVHENTEWASKELLEFVIHMKDGDNSVLSQFDVQALLLEYIKRNKLRDPRRKSQIVCDSRLVNLFGKARVGHFEMLKLLESHFLTKTDTQINDVQGIVVDTDVNQAERDGSDSLNIKGSKEKKRKAKKKGYGREPQSNIDDYAAIDNHNINLIYLRRKLIEDVLEDIDKFHETVIGTFVRIRISGNIQKQDLYRLVQVTGTTKADKPYKVGKRSTGFCLEVLNLDKTEVLAIDTISNQDFTEDECKRLRQSIKCGLINRLTVGDILHKATEIHALRVNDWLEAETQRISHLRDRASEKGRRKELRECVEKLQVLKTQEERRRRLDEFPEIHADPKMDPNYESEDSESDEETKQENFSRPRAVSGFSSRNGREPVSPGRGNLVDSGSGGSRKYSERNWEFSRSRSDDKSSVSTLLDESIRRSETAGRIKHRGVRSDSVTNVNSNTSSTGSKIKETEKVWLYKDPSGKIQGPFSVVQLRKWNNTGYFPTDLRIWRNNEDEDRPVFLKDALAGRFHHHHHHHHHHNKESNLSSPTPAPTPTPTPPEKKKVHRGDQNGDKWRSSPPATAQVSKLSTDRLGYDSLPSPTPNSTPTTPIVSSVVKPNSVEKLGVVSDLSSSREWASNSVLPKQEIVTQVLQQTSQLNDNVKSSSYGPNSISTTPTKAETWRPQQIVQQQQQQQPSPLPPNMPWRGNMAMQSSWGPMSGNQQMGSWGGGSPVPVPVPVPVPTPNMNWNMAPPPPPPPQGVPMNPSGGWVAAPGNHPGPIQQQQQQGYNMPGWFPQMGNHPTGGGGAMANTGQWFQPQPVMPNQAPSPGNMNGAPWGGGGGGPVQGHGNQNWSSNRGGGWNNNTNNTNQRLCQFHLNGHCKKGSACRQPHN